MITSNPCSHYYWVAGPPTSMCLVCNFPEQWVARAHVDLLGVQLGAGNLLDVLMSRDKRQKFFTLAPHRMLTGVP